MTQMWSTLWLIAAMSLATFATAGMRAEEAPKRIHLIIRGRVQGVGFRAFTVEEAQKRKLRGWVRNLRSGNEVELVAEGEGKSIGEFIERVKVGPIGSKVEKVEEKPPPEGDLPKFEERPTQ